MEQRFHAGMRRGELIQKLSSEGFDVQKVFTSNYKCFTAGCKKVEEVSLKIDVYRGGSWSVWSIYWEAGDQNDIVLFVSCTSTVAIN